MAAPPTLGEWLSGCSSHSSRVAEWLSGSSHSSRVAEWLSGCSSHSGRLLQPLWQSGHSCHPVYFGSSEADEPVFFSPTATSVAQGSLAQITFGAIRCSFNARIRMVPVQRLGEVPEGSGAHTQVRFRKVPVQRLGEVPEGSGSDFR